MLSQELRDSEYFIKVLRQHLPELKEKYSVSYLGIFGSYIRGEQTKDSDLDVLVQFDKKPGLLKYMELENYLSDLLGIYGIWNSFTDLGFLTQKHLKICNFTEKLVHCQMYRFYKTCAFQIKISIYRTFNTLPT